MGNRADYLVKARAQVELTAGNILQESMIYETAPWGNTNQSDFLNQVVVINTLLSPEVLLQTILEIERSLDRKRSEKWQPRSIDIDILFYNDVEINAHELVIPHPMIAERRFTLVPLAEIIPGYVHPGYKKTMKQMLEECIDKSNVNKYIFMPDHL